MSEAGVPAPPPGVRPLLAVLRAPAHAAMLDPAQWDTLLRTARSAHLLGTLAARLEGEAGAAAFPQRVREHLRGALLEARHLHKMAALEMAAAADTLAPLRMPLLLLKGASYIAAGLPHARGRLLRDVDILVPEARIAEAEQALVAAGWKGDDALDAYDQRYYRAWSHQIPPLRRPGHPLELDVHHTILPPTGRLHPDAAALLRDARTLDATWHVPDPADQVVHAAVHLFQDSDCTSRLRDLVDVDALCRHHAQREAAFWPRLAQRARLHGCERPLAYALAFARDWLGAPLDASFAAELAAATRWRTSGMVRRWAALTLPPADVEAGRSMRERRAARFMLARSLWLRMPPTLLVRHALGKAWRAVARRG